MASDDFAREMQQLAAQAERAASAKPEPAPASPSLQPVILGLEALSRGVTETSRVLNKLASDLAPVVASAATGAADPAQDKMAKSVEWIHTQLHRQGQVESANQKLFDAMHAELKSYKDAFLFDALHKPFVKDLITLADDIASISAGVQAQVPQAPESELSFLRKLTTNLDNCGAHFDEIFARLDVESFETKPGTEVDRQRHKTMSTEPAAHEDEDATVARSLRRGFLWRERVIRPEEVVVRKWTAPKLPQIIEVEVGGSPAPEREKSPA